MSYTETFHWQFPGTFATTYETSGYLAAVALPEGGVWEITEFGVNAATTYAAQNTNYQTFSLKDSSNNTIASVANGTSTTGLAIGPLVVTGIDTTMVAAYKNIDCTSAPKTVYVSTAATGNGRAMIGVSGWFKAILKRS